MRKFSSAKPLLSEDIAALQDPATPNSESGLRTRSVTGKRMPESTGRQLWRDRPSRGLTRVIAKQDYPGVGPFYLRHKKEPQAVYACLGFGKLFY